jgi:hypothetical protein
MMKVRRSTAEHPFGTIKFWMGATHFQMKTLKHVGTEMSLHVLAYNMKRVINILGTKQLIEAIQARVASSSKKPTRPAQLIEFIRAFYKAGTYKSQMRAIQTQLSHSLGRLSPLTFRF